MRGAGSRAGTLPGPRPLIGSSAKPSLLQPFGPQRRTSDAKQEERRTAQSKACRPSKEERWPAWRRTLASSSLPFHSLVSPLYSYRRSLRYQRY